MANGNDPNGTNAALRRLAERTDGITDVVKQLQSFMKGMTTTPKWIEDIPGARSPHFEVLEITIPANSTSKRSGTATISVDGPFVCTGIALFYCKTSGAYANIWGPATAFASHIAPVGMNFGFALLFDQPNCSSFTIEITAHGTERLWQSSPVSSALYSPQAGGAFILPASHLFPRASTITVSVTPDVEVDYTGKVQAIFLGYRIIQGYQYQP